MVKPKGSDTIEEQRSIRRVDLQSNFSAILYVITEQQALIGKLLQCLLDNGMLSSTQLTQITDLRGPDGKGDDLEAAYSSIYRTYAAYYLKTKHILSEMPPVEDGDSKDE